MNLYKAEVYTKEDKDRVCINFICPNCLPLVLVDHNVTLTGIVDTTGEKPYWCDNCGGGDDHPDYHKKLKEVLEKKGEITL